MLYIKNNIISNEIIFIFFVLFILFILLLLNFLLLFWAIHFHFIALLIVLDLILLINMLFFIFYTYLTINPLGYNIAIILLIVAACDTAIGLALFVTHYRLTGKTNFC